MVDLTVVILTWNRRYMINHVLHNLFRNDFPFKTVIIDNASTDGTKEYLVEHKDEIDRLILNERNVGCVAYNDGIRLCDGNYVSLQGDDHVLEPHWIDRMYHAVKTIENNVGNFGYVSSILHYALPRQWYEQPMTYDRWVKHPDIRVDPWEGTVESKSINKTHRYDGNVTYQEALLVGNSGTIFPMRTFKRLGLFRTYGLRGLYDGEFRHRCRIYGLSVGYTPDAAFLHVKENFVNPERVTNAFASVKPTPQQMEKLLKDFEEDKEAAQKRIPPPSAPKLREP